VAREPLAPASVPVQPGAAPALASARQGQPAPGSVEERQEPREPGRTLHRQQSPH